MNEHEHEHEQMKKTLDKVYQFYLETIKEESYKENIPDPEVNYKPLERKITIKDGKALLTLNVSEIKSLPKYVREKFFKTIETLEDKYTLLSSLFHCLTNEGY